jgi:hypothetical protein
MQTATIPMDPTTAAFMRAQAMHRTIDVIKREHKAFNKASEKADLATLRRCLHQFVEQGKRLSDLAGLLDAQMEALQVAMADGTAQD